MNEHLHPISRRDILQQRGVPKDFLTQMRPDGLQMDYVNAWAAPVTLIGLYPLDQQDTRRRIQETLSEVTSYTDYWQQRISHYNADQRELHKPQIDEAAMLTMLVDEQPQAARLDELAAEVHTLIADEEKSSVDLAQTTARLGVCAYKLLLEEPRYESALTALASLYKMPREELES